MVLRSASFMVGIAFTLSGSSFASHAQACPGDKGPMDAKASTSQAVFASAKSENPTVQVISVKELSAALKSKAKITIFDANGEKTRKKYGVIPGAKLLSHYRTFDVSAELPASKNDKVVFYCSSTQCSAAPQAAEKALGAGYTDVSVLKAGIKGWTKAGQSVDRPQKSS